MTGAPHDAKAVFFEALEQESPENLCRFLDAACSDDDDLRSRVEALLRAHQHAGQFLGGSAAEPTVNQPLTEQPGDTIGPYKLLQQIGEGGMGVVYMAEQTDPVERRVALKIIKPGMDTRQVIARFEAERQALALMDHPNIARVLDAGATDTGRPFFVMELVKGLPITRYCDEQHLTPRERLELFLPICQAVQHAHQKGIIHRDLKPSNILVAQYDGRPIPKVIDFGVAKAVSHKLTEKTMFTQYGQIVGTIEYMSPEQAELNQLDVDTRSDIYSLGVLLYELLTGETPFDKERLRSAAFDELLRIIREEEPPKPSTRLSSSEALPSIAASRRTEPKKLNLLVRGELDWIVMKALEKDRARRYETASRFAEDIQRYLNDEAVVACPPSAVYRFRKFARRNKVAIATTAAVALSLITGTSLATWQAIVATGERDRAFTAEALANDRLESEQAQRRRAEQAEQSAKEEAERANNEFRRAENETAIAHAVNAFLQGDLLAMNDAAKQFESEMVPDPNVRLRTVLDRSAEKVADRFADQPLVEAAVRDTIGQSYQALGLFNQAEEHHQRAREIREGLLGLEHPDTLVSMNNLANVMLAQGRYKDAENLHRQVMEIRQRVRGPEDPDTLVSMNNVANALLEQGRYDDAERLHRQVLEVRQRVRGPEHSDTLLSMNNLANVMRIQGRYADAEKLHLQVVEISQRVHGEEHPDTLGWMNNLATDILDQTRYDEAMVLFDRVLELSQRVLGPEHPDTLASMNNVANVLHWQGRDADAEDLYRQVLEIRRRVLGPDHPRTIDSICNLPLALMGQHQNAEAELFLRWGLELRQRVLSPEHPDTLFSMLNLGYCLEQQGKYQAAEELNRPALEIARQVFGEEHPDTLLFMNNLGFDLLRQGRYVEAGQFIVRTLELRRRQLAPDHPRLQTAIYNLSSLCWFLSTAADPQQRNPRRALEYAQTVVELRPMNGNDWDNLGVALCRNDRWPEAVEALEKARELRGGADPDHEFFLAMAYWNTGARDAAMEVYTRARVRCAFPQRYIGPDWEQLRFRDEAAAMIAEGDLEDSYTNKIADEPAVAEWRLARALWYEQESRLEQAAADYAEGIELVAKEPNAWWGAAASVAIHIAESPELYDRVLALRPEDEYLRVGHARRLAGTGHWQQAADEVQALADRNPTDQWHWCVLAPLKLQVGDVAGYRHVCEELLKRWSHDGFKPVLLITATACLLAPDVMSDRLDEIRSIVEDVLTGDPTPGWKDTFDCLAGLAAYRAGDFAVARLRLADAMSGSPNCQAIARVLLAMVDYREGRTDEAFTSYVQAVQYIDAQRPPSESSTYLQDFHGWLSVDILRREAEQTLGWEPGKQPFPAEGPATDDVELGPWMLLAGDEYFSRVTSEMPGNYRPWAARARIRALTGDWDGAALDYARVMEIVETIPDRLWGQRAMLAIETAERREVYERVLALRPEDTALWIARMRVLAAQNRWREAEAILQQLIDQDPDDLFNWFMMAPIELHLEDLEGYRQTCNELLNQRAGLGVLKVCLLTPGLMQDRQQEIISLGDEQLARTGDAAAMDPWFCLTRGLVAYRVGDSDAAQKWLEDALRGDDICRAPAQLLLAVVAHRDGRRDEALKYYRAAMDLEGQAFSSQEKRRMYWQDALIFEFLRREADQTLGIQPDNDEGMSAGER